MKKYFSHVVVVALSVLLASCGEAGSEDNLPVGSYVTISPEGKTWTLAGDPPPPCQAAPLHDSFHTIAVRNIDDQVLYNVPVTLSMDLSASNFSGFVVLQLFVDENRNNLPEVGELVSDNMSGAYNTTTSDEDGTLRVIVRMNLSCRYGGALTVQAGATSGSALFEVVE